MIDPFLESYALVRKKPSGFYRFVREIPQSP
jgi:hypothetical protein